MAFKLKRTLGCDAQDCSAEFTAVCRKNAELEGLAEDRGWFIISEKGNVWTGFKPPIHLCPEHRKNG